jgi:hypothetical protein
MDANPPAPPVDAAIPINPFNGDEHFYVTMQGKKLSQWLYSRYYQVKCTSILFILSFDFSFILGEVVTISS